jgi:ABC-type antimicrobial peptide transport system permease subunit
LASFSFVFLHYTNIKAPVKFVLFACFNRSAPPPPAAVLVALGFSAGVGIFFGFYPAWRAARMDPIESLRHE